MTSEQITPDNLQVVQHSSANQTLQGSAKQQLLVSINSLTELKDVDRVIRSKFKSDAELLIKIPEYLLLLGGKRMRPVLTLLCAKTLGMQTISNSVIDVAAGIELIHMATLLHDDIIDNSPLRRHKESPFIKFGMSNSLLAGDFLLVRAFSLCATLDPEIIAATEIACVHLTEGEILEIPLYEKTQSVSDSLIIATKKTAALFKLAAFSGAFLSNNNLDVIKAFSTFGENLGIAFQILDDILDVTSDEDLLGKPSGTDIRERKPSLVNILWLESGAASAQRLLSKPAADEQEFVASAVQELRHHQHVVVQQAKTMARQYADNAKAALEEALASSNCPANPSQQALFSLIDYTLERVL